MQSSARTGCPEPRAAEDTAGESSIHYRLPTLNVPYPPPLAHPDGAGLRRQVCQWAARHGIIGPRGQERLLSSNLLDLGLAMTSGAPTERGAVLLSWFLWMLLLDDRVDNGPWAEHGAFERFAGDVARVLAEEAGPAAADIDPALDLDPMAEALRRDLWPRTSLLGGTRWRTRIAGHLLEHLDAQAVLVRHRDGCEDIDYRSYLTLRPALFGAELFFDLIEALDAPPADDEASAARHRGLRRIAADIIAWTNDVYSLEKDLATGEEANLVVLLRREHGSDWQEAIDTAGRMIEERTEELVRCGVEQPSAFTDRLRTTVRASLDWHRTSARYRWQHRPDGQDAAIVDTCRTQPSLTWPDLARDPYPYYALLRERFPVAYDEPLDAWLLSRFADVRIALTDPCFTSESYSWQLAPMFGRTVMQMSGAEHAAHRAFLVPAFRGRTLTELRQRIDTIAGRLVGRIRDRLQPSDQVDLVATFCRQLPVHVVVATLGLPEADVPQLQRWYQAGFSYLGNYRQDPAALAGGLTARDELYDYLDDIVRYRRANPGSDLISALCQARVDGRPLADAVIKGFCGMLLGAGGETTDKALSSYLVNILGSPETQEAIQDNPAAGTPHAWAESLRRNPPVHVVLRQTASAVELPSGQVPAGATVACLIGSANRDPDRFPDPDRFDPGRTGDPVAREFTAAASHLAFGAGRHFCLGAQVALAEAEIGVGRLLRELPDLRLAPGFRPHETGLLTRAPESVLVATARPGSHRPRSPRSTGHSQVG